MTLTKQETLELVLKYGFTIEEVSNPNFFDNLCLNKEDMLNDEFVEKFIHHFNPYLLTIYGEMTPEFCIKHRDIIDIIKLVNYRRFKVNKEMVKLYCESPYNYTFNSPLEYNKNIEIAMPCKYWVKFIQNPKWFDKKLLDIYQNNPILKGCNLSMATEKWWNQTIGRDIENFTFHIIGSYLVNNRTEHVILQFSTNYDRKRATIIEVGKLYLSFSKIPQREIPTGFWDFTLESIICGEIAGLDWRELDSL